MIKRSLKFKLATGGILVVLFPLILVGYLSTSKVSKALLSVGKSEAQQVAVNLAGMTQLLFEKERDLVKALSTDPAIINAAISVHENGVKNSLDKLKYVDQLLGDKMKEMGKDYEILYIANADGIAVADSMGGVHRENQTYIGDRNYFQEALQGHISVADPVKSRASARGNPVTAIVVPLKTKSGEFAGIFSIVTKLDSLSKKITEIKLGKTGYLYMVDKTGMAIAHPKKESIFKINISKTKGMESIFSKISDKKIGVEEYILDGVDKIAGFAPIPMTGWAVIATQDKSELMSVINSIKTLVLVVGAGFLFVTILVIFWFSGTITKPIKELVDVFEVFGKGDMNVRADIKSNDEIGYFAEKFNEMLKQIYVSSVTLKKSESKYRLLLENLQNTVNKKDYSFRFTPESQEDDLSISLNNLLLTLEVADAKTNSQDWLKTGQANLNNLISGERDLTILCQKAITFIAKYVRVRVGTFFIRDPEKEEFKLITNYAFKQRKGLVDRFKPGEGLAGQAALEKEAILFSDVPKDYIRIESSLGNTLPTNIFALPLIFEKNVKGVIELGSVNTFTKLEIQFIESAGDTLAVALNAAMFNEKLEKLLDYTKNQSLKLKEQQEELKAANEELEEQTIVLKKSEAKLQLQQEELQASNEEMEEKTEILEKQKSEIEKNNTNLKIKQKEVEEKAKQLELATRYKSEFLANMSHELRTPLNSLLILANMLAENEEKNLNSDQIESAQSIHRSGRTLLLLINDILDLSKIEAKKVELLISKFNIENLGVNCKAEFSHMAGDKGIDFNIDIKKNLPETITTDELRLNQIIRNLMGNAIKFTEKGSVSLIIDRPDPDILFDRKDLDHEKTIAIAIADTGPGIPKDRLNHIFQAFRQVDGSISRRHGGTGLGLSISRELAFLIGGEIKVTSIKEKGSVFTLYIPQTFVSPKQKDKKNDILFGKNSAPIPETKNEGEVTYEVSPGKKEISAYSKTMLIIEDDNEFAGILADFFQKNGYESIIASDGETGIKFVIEHQPTAIILDIGLPGIDGWAVLSELKNNAATRHIPVHIMSAFDDTRQGLEKGAVGYLTKPVDVKGLQKALNRIDNVLTSNVKELLIVEDNNELRMSIVRLMKTNDIHAVAVGTGKKAHGLLKKQKFDCMILDLGLPDITGFELMDIIEKDPDVEKIPVIVYTGRELSQEETQKLERYSSSIVLKSAVSMERLLDETALFMHRVENDMPEKHKKMIQGLRDNESILQGKKVLLVDDDMRNAFALNKSLTSRGMVVKIANNGKKAIEILEQEEHPDIVLMDIMMPVMDGYETMKRIRKNKEFKDLPILALTAKAMESDREECIKFGANDYLSKPIDTSKLLTMLRVWLYP